MKQPARNSDQEAAARMTEKQLPYVSWGFIEDKHGNVTITMNGKSVAIRDEQFTAEERKRLLGWSYFVLELFRSYGQDAHQQN
jgi:hypothetical protein